MILKTLGLLLSSLPPLVPTIDGALFFSFSLFYLLSFRSFEGPHEGDGTVDLTIASAEDFDTFLQQVKGRVYGGDQ